MSPQSKKRVAIRAWVVAPVLVLAAFILCLAWPRENDPFELSRADGRPRFFATVYSKTPVPPNLPLAERLVREWYQYKRHHGTPNPASWSFPATPVQLCSIHGLLSQCMEVAGTRYLIAVEAGAASVEFGSTNALNGAQWVAAFERAIETSDGVLCTDLAKRQGFRDKLLLIRERPRVVKVVPRSRLAEYQNAGLVRANSR